jgi:hypothetical protein
MPGLVTPQRLDELEAGLGHAVLAHDLRAPSGSGQPPKPLPEQPPAAQVPEQFASSAQSYVHAPPEQVNVQSAMPPHVMVQPPPPQVTSQVDSPMHS